MKVDLHNHTKYSDGVWTCKELIEEAIKANVDIFAITDHDSVFGVEEILEEVKNYNNIDVIPGVEISTNYKGQSVHIVCLFKDKKVPKEMMEFSIQNKQKRIDRAILMMNKIHEIYGLKVDIDELLKTGKVITRGNMLRNIAKCNNLSFEEAQFYITQESKAYIPASKLTVQDGLDLARSSNAIAIFAHPCLVKREYLKEILDFGFDGIEVYYPLNQNDDEEYMKSLAKEYNLFWSAGSDCHGDKTHANIGTCCLTKEEFMPMAKVLNYELEE